MKLWLQLLGLALMLAPVHMLSSFIAEATTSVDFFRTLLIVDDINDEFAYSLFIGDLKDSGHIVSVRYAGVHTVALENFGDALFDNLIIFASQAEKICSLSVHDVLAFSERGGSVVVGVDESLSNRSFVYDLAIGSGVKFNAGRKVVDHFSFDGNFDFDADHSAILTDNYISLSEDIFDAAGDCSTRSDQHGCASFLPMLLYSGIDHHIMEANTLATTVVSGRSTSVVPLLSPLSLERSTKPVVTTRLVTVFQSRTNSRLLFTGSLMMFSNHVLNSNLQSGASLGNRRYIAQLLRWVVGGNCVLRALRPRLSRVESGTDVYLDVGGVVGDGAARERDGLDRPFSEYAESEVLPQSAYYTLRVGEAVCYSVELQLQNDEGLWVPFGSKGNGSLGEGREPQVEVVMLDVHVRRTLSYDAVRQVHSACFSMPDQVGVFLVRLSYNRRGLGRVLSEYHVSLRPLRHNEHERFLATAHPYYVSVGNCLLVLVLFSVAYLFI
jgi:hypothetical protein